VWPKGEMVVTLTCVTVSPLSSAARMNRHSAWSERCIVSRPNE